MRPPDRDEIHLWWVALDRTVADEARLRALLTEDERARAAAYARAVDRRRFLVARAVLRRLLGRYLDAPPAAVPLAYGPRGKPHVTGRADLRFNVSHSAGLALIGVARGREIGVDVERVRDDVDIEAFAARSFSPRELAALRALEAPARRRAFFDCWTRKEAYIKARGDGLAIPLDAFDVSVAPGERATLLEVRADPLEAHRWSLIAPVAPAGFAAAVAVEVAR